MSTFAPAPVACPRCGRVDERALAGVVDAARHPHHRAAILDGGFQRFRCDGCAAEILVEEPFLYLDLGRKLLIAFGPTDEEGAWPRYQRMAMERYRADLGADAPPAARRIGEGVRVRVVFGFA